MTMVYIITTEGWGDDAGTQLHYATLDKTKAEKILHLFETACKISREKHIAPKELDILQQEYGIITWTGRAMSIEELELK